MSGRINSKQFQGVRVEVATHVEQRTHAAHDTTSKSVAVGSGVSVPKHTKASLVKLSNLSTQLQQNPIQDGSNQDTASPIITALPAVCYFYSGFSVLFLLLIQFDSSR